MWLAPPMASSTQPGSMSTVDGATSLGAGATLTLNPYPKPFS